MTSIRRMASALMVAGALIIPAFASADEPTPMCDGEHEGKAPTADKSDAKHNSDKSGKKSDEKTDQKSDAKETDKS